MSEDNILGTTFDLGAGRLPAKHLIQTISTRYIGFDRYISHPDLDIVGDAEALPVKSNIIDSVFSCSIFEHLPRPWIVVQEMNRILKNNGKVVLIAPLLYYIHDEPNDYYRYTEYGLRSLFESAGFEIEYVYRQTGIVGFLFSFPITLIFALLYGHKLLFWPYYYFNKLLVLGLSKIDDLLAGLEKKILPLAYYMVFHKIDKNTDIE
jgi:SAM-dependent methyltransferase